MRLIILFLIFMLTLGHVSAYSGSESGYHVKLITPQEFSTTSPEDAYKMSFIVNPDTSGFLRTEGNYKIGFNLYTSGVGGSYCEDGCKLHLVPDEAFISYTYDITANDPCWWAGTWISASITCPANLHAYDSLGRHVGVNTLGEIDLEIPDAYYTGPDCEPERIIIPDQINNIIFKVEALDAGEFNFTLIQNTDAKTITVTYLSVPITETTVATVDVSQANPTYTMEIDDNGDGTPENTREPDSIKIIGECTPPSAPALNDPGTTDTDGSYTVSWSSVIGATSYTLEEDTSGSFGSPTVVYSGSGTSKYITGRSDGTYYYRVNACNACGCSGWSNVGDIEVIPSGNIPPVASFTYSPLNPVVDQMVAFDLSSSCDPDGQITHYRLDFGDESGAEGPGLVETIGHEYSSAGNYIVTLTVTDDYGATGTETKTVIVTLTVSLIGDLNHDGILTPADAAIVLQIAACGGWDPAADMNSDDCITSLDALMILSMTPTTQPSREPPCDSYGDVDDDSYVTVDDYDLVHSYVEGGWDAVKGKTSLTSEEEFKRRADIDGDDEVSFFDSVFIDHYINGTYDTFPLCP